ncbi:MAG TPA: hypothetical protein VHV83_07180 [Armatimonadota bacterium]|nr:hypothetical protein [Armatimonadota bacterium]
MTTIAEKVFVISLLVWLLGLWCLTPVQAFPIASPTESLAGLTPGINTIADASRLYGVYNVRLPGDFLAYLGGPYASHAYRWTNGLNGKVPGLIIETAIGSPRIDAVVVDEYPGLATSCGLMALTPERSVLSLYGSPNYAYEITLGNNRVFRELYFIDRGLLVVLGHEFGIPNWTVSRIILTYPTYLRNAVSKRYRYALNGQYVEDVICSYRARRPMPLPCY